MPAYYFDTSALAKRYVVEVGSSWVQAIVAQQSGHTIYTSVLTQPEIVSALQRRVREGRLEAHQAQQLAQQVVEHMTLVYPRGDHATNHHAGLCVAATTPAAGLRCATLSVCPGHPRGDCAAAVGRTGVRGSR